MSVRRAIVRKIRAAHRRIRELWLIGKGILSTRHPVQVHLIPIRRCNLSCSYCNEYDEVSQPVPTEEMLRRVDRIASFGTTLIVISGGEPLLHPEIEKIIAHIRRRGMIVAMITNGYLLTKDKIESLNRAGLDHLQISIDNAQPDDVSMKSLKVLDKKLQLLAEHAEFHVNINSVVGSGVKHPEDALLVARRAQELGFSSTVGIIHDGSGQLKPLGARDREIFETIMGLEKRSYARFNQFQWNIAHGKPNDWSCRAGSRYLYICEDGLVHYCSQQRGAPGVPLEKYTREDLRREYYTRKGCAPLCTISCVQQTAMLDNWRAPQRQFILPAAAAPTPEPLVQLTGARAEE